MFMVPKLFILKVAQCIAKIVKTGNSPMVLFITPSDSATENFLKMKN